MYYIDYNNSFILSSHSDLFYRYDMYLYIRTCSHNVKYLVNYQYLKLNTKHGSIGTQCWVHKFNLFLNLDLINPYLQIQTLYISISPLYEIFFNVLCCLKLTYLVYPVYFLITPYLVSSCLYTCILIIYKFCLIRQILTRLEKYHTRKKNW